MKFFKKLIAVLCIALSVITITPAITPSYADTAIVAQAAKVKISNTKRYMVKGQTYTLKITGTKKAVKWKSSKTSVATVSSKGKVTAKKKGTATITAKVGGKNYKCSVIVEAPKIGKTSISLQTGNSYTLKISGTKQSIKWSSSNKSIATVSSKGIVKGVKAGSATITAKLSCGKKYTYKVTVLEPAVNLAKIQTTNYNISGNKGVVSIVKNNNPMAIKVTVTVLYYDSNGSLISTNSENNYCLQSGRTCALKISAPYDSNYKRVAYSSYKVKVSATKCTNMIYGAGSISLDINNSPSTEIVVIGATNVGSKNFYSVQLAIVFFDSNGQCIGYDYAYPECGTAGSTDYVNFRYPYDSNYDTITPSSYKVYVNNAYDYSWNA